MPETFSLPRAVVIFGVLALVSALGLVLALSSQVRQLLPQASELRYRRTFPYVTQVVPVVPAVTVEGDSLQLGSPGAGRSQVLVFFNATCDYCRRSWPFWNQLAARLQADAQHRFDMIGVSLSAADSTRMLLQERPTDFPVVRSPSLRDRRVLRVRSVPTTLVIDADGVIAFARPWVFDSTALVDSAFAAAVRASKGRAPEATPPGAGAAQERSPVASLRP